MPLFRVYMTGIVHTTLIVKAPSEEALEDLTHDYWSEKSDYNVEWSMENPEEIEKLKHSTHEKTYDGELNYDVEFDENGDEV